MPQNTSTKNLGLLSNERLYIRKYTNQFSKFKSEKIQFFTFNSGFKKKHDDLLIVIFKKAVSVAAIYSKTSTPSGPIIWNKSNNKGFCKVLIVNAGNANAHTGKKGINSIDFYIKVASKKFNCPIDQILVSSTGVIGEQLDYKKIINKLEIVDKSKSKDLLTAAKAIMTTDTYPKTSMRKIRDGKKEIRIFGFAKGSGMIAPNMGTMLAYIFIEANLNKKILNKFLNSNVESTFNSITVDGDTSTSDTLLLFSIGNNQSNIKINNILINKIFKTLKDVMMELAKKIVLDGEGISKLMIIKVSKGKSYKQVSSVAFSIANSLLVKTAIAGQDANWGRIIMAIGKSEEKINQNKIKLYFGNLLVAKNGEKYTRINIKKLDSYMKNKIIEINVELNLGKATRIVYSSDLTHEYIRINGDYRS